MFERWAEGALLDVLGKEGIGCIAFSPLAQGLLTDKYLNGIPEGSRAAKSWGFLKPEQVEPAIEKVKKLNEIALKRRQTLAQMALAWLLKDSRVTSVLIGASSVKQLEDNVAALNNLAFTNEEQTQIEIILSKRRLMIPRRDSAEKNVTRNEPGSGDIPSRGDFIKNLAKKFDNNRNT
jgi:L-glyceraldehyde 3-phosphate reductase